jgi:beta-lactamase regulating signal transducer with metallopeptidase domain
MSAIIYLLQVSACMAIFYGFYYLLLNRLTFFTINRYYLLFTLVLSFIIPLLTIPVQQQYTVAPVMQQVIQMRSIPTLPSAYTAMPVIKNINTDVEPITWMQLLSWCYLAAVGGLLLHLFTTLANFFAKLKRRKLSSLGNIHILRGDKKLPNGSFLNYIFLNDDALSAEEMEQIVAHEMLHVKLFHSADRILMKLVQIILWFNPLVYFYARSMEENHEFEVDREVAQSTDKTKYADLLLHLSVANQGMLYHSFSKVPLKKRIIMLFNQPSAKIKKVVYILVLPVILLSCLAFGKIKKEDIKIDLVKSGKEIISAIKTGQDNMVAQLNKPVQLPAIMLNTESAGSIMLNAHSIKTISINTTSQTNAIPITVNDTTRYSAFGNFSKNAKVTINGKEYPADILYEISNSNLTSISFNRNGQNGQDVINITTEDGQIIYMSAGEKDNLRKTKTTPINQFYTRLKLTKDNGERYDYIVIRIYNSVGSDAQGRLSHVPGSRHSDLRVGPNDKIGFIINGKFYGEDELETVPPALIANLNRFGSATYGGDMLYQNKYKFVFTLSTSDYADAQSNNTTAGGGRFGGGASGGGRFGGGGGRSYTDTTRGISYYNNLGFFNGQMPVLDATNRSLRNYIIAGYPVDTIAYNAQSYKMGLSPDAKLIDLVKKLPTFTTKENAVYIGGKVINALYFDKGEYGGWVIQGLNSLPASNVVEIKITSPDPKNLNPAILYIINKTK